MSAARLLDLFCNMAICTRARQHQEQSSRQAESDREGSMSMLDVAVIGFGSFVVLTAIGLVFLLAANRH